MVSVNDCARATQQEHSSELDARDLELGVAEFVEGDAIRVEPVLLAGAHGQAAIGLNDRAAPCLAESADPIGGCLRGRRSRTSGHGLRALTPATTRLSANSGVRTVSSRAPGNRLAQTRTVALR